MYLMDSQRIDIGKKIFTHKMSKKDAMKEYEINSSEVNSCVKAYLRSENISIIPEIVNKIDEMNNKNYSEMEKHDLVNELMLKDIEIARLKKGYIVKGGGKTKEYNILKDPNSK